MRVFEENRFIDLLLFGFFVCCWLFGSFVSELSFGCGYWRCVLVFCGLLIELVLLGWSG